MLRLGVVGVGHLGDWVGFGASQESDVRMCMCFSRRLRFIWLTMGLGGEWSGKGVRTYGISCHDGIVI